MDIDKVVETNFVPVYLKMTLGEIMSVLDLPKTSTYDILKALVSQNMIDEIRADGLIYRIGLKSFQIGNSYLSNTDLINYAKKNNIPIPKDKKGAPPFSIDDNIFHTSTEGKVLEDPKNSAPEFIFQRTASPEKAPNKTTKVTVTFKNSDPIAVNGKKLSPEKLLEKLNLLAGKNGIGRVDLVENRFF